MAAIFKMTTSNIMLKFCVFLVFRVTYSIGHWEF